jgi:hypothetical protein
MEDQTKMQNTETTHIGALTLSKRFDKVVKAIGEVQYGFNQDANILGAKNATLGNLYLPLHLITKVLSPLLHKAGATLIQPYEVIGGSKVRVTTTLFVEDQYATMTSEMTADTYLPQSVGSALTYNRRYSVMAFLGLSTEASADFDDDANSAGVVTSAVKEASKKVTKQKVDVQPPPATAATNELSIEYSPVLAGYLSKIAGSDVSSLKTAETQISSFKLEDRERNILLKAIQDRLSEILEQTVA